MGSCGLASPKKGNLANGKNASYRQIMAQLREKQVKNLELIFKDLSSRSSQKRINKQSFLLFFKKHGYWGDCLFNEFDIDQSDLLNMNEFIVGITKILKAKEDEKTELLYRFFSRNSPDNDGIRYKDFLRMIYNYPKQDLVHIINEKEFIEKEIIQFNLGTEANQPNQPQEQQNQQIKLSSIYRSFSYQNPNCQGISKVINRIVKCEQPGNTVVLQFDENKYFVKALGMNKLIKKFAKKVFKDYEIDIKTGKLSKEQFKDWIINHKSLYENYYNGFREEIWGTFINQQKQCPNYTKMKAQLQTQAKMIITKQKRQQIKSVQLLLIGAFLIVTNYKDIKQTLDIICLDGLSVEGFYEIQLGYGFHIRHQDGIYSSKKIILKHQDMKDTWMHSLRFYKGFSIFEKYKFGMKLGAGKFSIVYECTNRETQKQYACKQIETYKLSADSKEIIAHQSAIMVQLNHPFLVRFHERIQTRTHLYIITQLIKGKDLSEYVKSRKILSQYEAAVICKQIILGTQYLHGLGIVHRDLKPQNILVQTVITPDEEGQTQGQKSRIKIIDFGFAQYVSVLANLEGQKFIVGTPHFIAPQVLKEDQITFKADNFAIGSILYYMLSGTYAFRGFNITEILHNTIDGQFDFQDEVWKHVSDTPKDLIKKLLCVDVDQRISLEKALNHPFFKNKSTDVRVKNNIQRVKNHRSATKKQIDIF